VDNQGAGDQGIMFGYACSETEELMPATLVYSHKILQAIYESQKNGKISGFGADAKSQVTLQYKGDRVVSTDTVLVSIQHNEGMSQEDIVKQIRPMIQEVIPEEFLLETKYLFNPTGKFVIGGPESDVGLTGRKIIVDTYGGATPHGGGAFSGKDPTKVDRSAAYMARYLAKNIVAAKVASKCLIQLSYAIGMKEPISVYVNTYNTGAVEDDIISNYIRRNIDLTPKGIREHLKLNNPIYFPTASYGHFGREYDNTKGLFIWEDVSSAKDFASNILD
jgi:S-adenosylmethionine synthetase